MEKCDEILKVFAMSDLDKITQGAKIYTNVSQLSGKIADFQRQIGDRKIYKGPGICGFDGFIDTFIQMQNPATMDLFGSKVLAAAGMAASYPVHHLEDKFGGNGPLLAVALYDILCGEADISYIGALGKNSVLPIFQSVLGGKMKNLFTLADPAHSDCIEFKDGKVMLSDLRSCGDICWERLIECIGAERMDVLLQESQFIAAVNWGKLTNVGSIWQKMAERLERLNVPRKKVLFFMDLAEFEHRPRRDIQGMIELVGKITMQCYTVLSLNLKEAWQMASEFRGDFHGKKAPEDIAALAAFLRDGINVDKVLIHPNDGASCASREGCVYIPGPFCEKPLISTGAGDNFGAGCMAGLLSGMDDEEILLSGVCASGYFVRSGKSPSYPEIGRLASLWSNGQLPERL